MHNGIILITVNKDEQTACDMQDLTDEHAPLVL